MNNVEKYFDQVASNWDKHEILPLKIKEDLIELLKIKEGDDVLDVACGTGVITNILFNKSKKQVTAIDISKNMIDIAKDKYHDNINNFNFISGDLLTYNFDKKFDYVVIYNAYPHFLDVEKLIIKINDILNANGHFAILHSMSLNTLNAHHKHVDKSLYREIESLKDEAKKFEKYFQIENIYEGEYLLLKGSKK